MNIEKQARNIVTAPALPSITGVHLDVSDTLWYEAGDRSGRVLTVQNPWGTQEMCEDILASVAGKPHQPLQVEGGYLDPACELGDGLTADGVTAPIYGMTTRFGPCVTMDTQSPGEQSVDSEIPYKPRTDRKIERQFREVRASLRVQADAITAEVTARESDTRELRAGLQTQAGEISAKVEKSGGGESFGWEMNESEQVWKAGGAEIFRLDQNGAVVTGEIRATAGTIGGFTIKERELAANGISIGPGGISLGDGFCVDAAGNLTASSGSFTGSVNAGSIRYGGDYGKLNGSGISSGSIGDSRIISNDLTTGSMVTSIGTSLANANNANAICTGTKTSSLLKASSIVFDSHTLGRSTVNINGTPTQVVVWI